MQPCNHYIYDLLLYSGDFMYVFDGNSTDPKNLINTETGVILPSDIQSTSSEMVIVFTSDFSHGKTGFIASISFLRSGIKHENFLI